MTPPNWLQGPNVKVYATEHLPVVRVEDGKVTFGPNDFDKQVKWVNPDPDSTPMKPLDTLTIFKKGKPLWVDMNVYPDIADALYPELRAAWERKVEALEAVSLGVPHLKTIVDGFYFLRPERPKHIGSQFTGEYAPPELVPCEDVTQDYIQYDHTYYSEICRDTLVFYLPERECSDCEGSGFLDDKDLEECPDCMSEGIIKEKIHVVTKED